MTELDKLIALIEDGHLIRSIRTMEDLEAYFANSRTGIAEVGAGLAAGDDSHQQGSEVRGPRSEVRGPRSEVRGPRSEVRGPRSEHSVFGRLFGVKR
jgi:hypothetical protein